MICFSEAFRLECATAFLAVLISARDQLWAIRTASLWRSSAQETDGRRSSVATDFEADGVG
jgi:hypothetical protein